MWDGLDSRVERNTGRLLDILGDANVVATFFILGCVADRHPDLIRRIEHFGSTAVPGLSAKPIVDMLVEVTGLAATRTRIAPVLESQGYDYLWRPTNGDDGPPFYAFFIKRDPVTGDRTHHIHMVPADFQSHWDRLLFRDFLIAHPDVAARYQPNPQRLALLQQRLQRVREIYQRLESLSFAGGKA